MYRKIPFSVLFSAGIYCILKRMIKEELMPRILPNSDLQHHYNDISEFCHTYSEPVFITKDGMGDLAVMSMEMYEMLAGKADLHELLDEGLTAVKEGKTRPMADVFCGLREKISG
jgi:PHD/YefM family antitoxin component YafN of YafNO toxin-antitoxin module